MNPKHLIMTVILSLLGRLCADELLDQKPTVYTAAVFNFAEGSKELAGQGESIGELMNAFLSTTNQLVLVERVELDKILSEQKLSLSGNVSPDNTIKVGKLTGAQILITGRVFHAGSKTYAVAKVMSSETGRVFAATETFTNDDEIGDIIEKLAAKVAKLVNDKGEDLVPSLERYEALIIRLKKGLVAPLPTVFVKIPEHHLAQVVPDPACQTEILKILKDCGFGITTDSKESDIQIKGEAFSEFAARREDLVACRARVEIEIFRDGGKELSAVDRVMVGAVDLAEGIAGKAALQEAGYRLAIRFVEGHGNQ